jgi:hypothetical protein
MSIHVNKLVHHDFRLVFNERLYISVAVEMFGWGVVEECPGTPGLFFPETICTLKARS